MEKYFSKYTIIANLIAMHMCHSNVYEPVEDPAWDIWSEFSLYYFCGGAIAISFKRAVLSLQTCLKPKSNQP